MPISDLLPWNRDKTRYDLQRSQDHSLDDLQNEMNLLFDNFFTTPFAPALSRIQNGNEGFNPVVDISETEKEFIVRVDLPGMDKKDINLTIVGNQFTISGSKVKETDEKNARYHKVERQYGSFRRSLTLPVEVDIKTVDATFSNGVLKVVIPKPSVAPAAIRRIPIKVK